MMSVSESIFQEADFFAVSVISGCLMVFLYDVLRVFRRLTKHGTLWIALEDIVYWMISALLIFAMLYRKNDGLIRGFAIGGIVIGMLFYNHFISPRVVKGVVWLVKKMIRLFSFPLRLLKKILRRPAAFVGRKGARGVKKVKKLLKKIHKAGKIILYKH